jgi:hypothetical protein
VLGGAIPKDLFWLISECQLSPRQVWALMRIAKSNHNLLSTVCAARRRHIDGKRGRSAYAYLLALAKSGTDFGAISTLQERDARRTETETRAADLHAETSKRLQLQAQVLTTANGRRLRTLPYPNSGGFIEVFDQVTSAKIDLVHAGRVADKIVRGEITIEADMPELPGKTKRDESLSHGKVGWA